MTSNDLQWPIMNGKDLKWHEMIQNESQWYKITWNNMDSEIDKDPKRHFILSLYLKVWIFHQVRGVSDISSFSQVRRSFIFWKNILNNWCSNAVSMRNWCPSVYKKTSKIRKYQLKRRRKVLYFEVWLYTHVLL